MFHKVLAWVSLVYSLFIAIYMLANPTGEYWLLTAVYFVSVIYIQVRYIEGLRK